MDGWYASPPEKRTALDKPHKWRPHQEGGIIVGRVCKQCGLRNDSRFGGLIGLSHKEVYRSVYFFPGAPPDQVLINPTKVPPCEGKPLVVVLGGGP